MPATPGIDVLYVEEIEQLAQRLQPCKRYFTLFLAWDAQAADQAQLRKWMQPLVDRGLIYFCAWGRECKAVHDAVDICDIEREKRSENPDFIIMTTWHDDEPLEEALWFFQMLALPTEESIAGNFDRLAVAVGNPHWAEEMRDYLSKSDTV
jgi:hypothetical protein